LHCVGEIGDVKLSLIANTEVQKHVPHKPASGVKESVFPATTEDPYWEVACASVQLSPSRVLGQSQPVQRHKSAACLTGIQPFFQHLVDIAQNKFSKVLLHVID
jgi:hypothetical protein